MTDNTRQIADLLLAVRVRVASRGIRRTLEEIAAAIQSSSPSCRLVRNVCSELMKVAERADGIVTQDEEVGNLQDGG